MIRGIALTVLMVSVAAIGLVAITRPEVFGQTPGTPQSILENSPARQDAASGDDNAIRQAAVPGEQGASSPHDSPESLYAEFVAACAEQKASRVVACLTQDGQSRMAGAIVAAAMELEFDPQYAEPVRKALVAHGIDPKSLPAERLGFDYRLSAGKDIEKLWQDEVMPRIRNVPELIADLEPLLQKAGHGKSYNAGMVLQIVTFGNQKFGFLRDLNVERDMATATVRVQLDPASGYPQNRYEGTLAGQANQGPNTAWTNITFRRIDGKWYLAKFDEFADDVAKTDSQVGMTGQALPSPYWHQDDVQYFTPGDTELDREAAAQQRRRDEIEAQNPRR